MKRHQQARAKALTAECAHLQLCVSRDESDAVLGKYKNTSTDISTVPTTTTSCDPSKNRAEIRRMR
jgi:hypothetical protein